MEINVGLVNLAGWLGLGLALAPPLRYHPKQRHVVSVPLSAELTACSLLQLRRKGYYVLNGNSKYSIMPLNGTGFGLI